MLSKADAASETLPPVLSTNLHAGSLGSVSPFIVKEFPMSDSPAPLRVGVFSLMGVDAAFASRGNRAGEAIYVGYNDTNDSREPHLLHVLHFTLNLFFSCTDISYWTRSYCTDVS